MNAVVAFLEERGQDGSGRFVSDVLNFGLGALESQPAYIPWFFPLIQPSADARSPGLDQTDVDQIRASERARGNLLKAAQRMAWFYDQTDHWLAASDHNHGRITRIIKRLRLLVSDSVANGFRDAILVKAGRPRSKVGANTAIVGPRLERCKRRLS